MVVGRETLVVKKVTFSYEAYANDHDLTRFGKEDEAERIQAKLRELLPQIDCTYTTGREALKVDKLVVRK